MSVILALAACGVASGAASAQSKSTRVSWAPSYGGSCVSCDLRGRNMSGGDISAAHYPKANVSGAFLRGTRALNIDLSDAMAKGTDFRRATLDGSRLSNTQFEGSRFERASLLNVNLTGASLSDTHLTGARFGVATATGTNFSRARASGTDFSGANLTGAIFEGAILREAQFNNAILNGTSFANADLHGARLTNIRLINVSFEGATGLESTIFEGSCAGEQTNVPAGIALLSCQAVRLPGEEELRGGLIQTAGQ